MMNFWKAGFAPTNSALVVAGDVTEKELRAMAEKYFGKWSGKAQTVKLPDVGLNTTRQILILDKPGAPQTALRVGHLGVARSNPDYVPLEIMNLSLGGLFTSRIN